MPLLLDRGDHKAPEILRLNPMGKVPIVVVDGHPVWESPAIVAHLGDLFPEAGLAPAPGTPERADFYRWLSFATAVMEPAFAEHMMQHKPNLRAFGWGDFASMKGVPAPASPAAIGTCPPASPAPTCSSAATSPGSPAGRPTPSPTSPALRPTSSASRPAPPTAAPANARPRSR